MTGHEWLQLLYTWGIPGTALSAAGWFFRTGYTNKQAKKAAPDVKIEKDLARAERVGAMQDRIVDDLERRLTSETHRADAEHARAEASEARERSLHDRLATAERQLEATRKELAQIRASLPPRTETP